MEGTGVTPWLVRTTLRLAQDGWLVAAPDLYHRSGGSDAEGWMEQFRALDDDAALADFADAAQVLRDHGARRVGMIGFCMGGRFTYLASGTPAVGIDAGVSCYGGAIDQVASRPACPWLGFFGTADPYIPPESLAVIRDRHPDDVVVYEGADHGFLRDGSEAYHPDAAPDAWARALAFLGRHLDG
jgi:carboxymethylenebutenolidase